MIRLWPAGTLDANGIRTPAFQFAWWLPTPTRFVTQALIGPKPSNPVEVWIW